MKKFLSVIVILNLTVIAFSSYYCFYFESYEGHGKPNMSNLSEAFSSGKVMELEKSAIAQIGKDVILFSISDAKQANDRITKLKVVVISLILSLLASTFVITIYLVKTLHKLS